MKYSDVLQSDGTFKADALLSAGEQAAADKLKDALSEALAGEGEVISVATAFIGAMIGGEAAVAALETGAGITAAVSAGVSAAEAGAVVAGAAASGPFAAMTISAFIAVEILTTFWGASAGAGCCGPVPDPTPARLVTGQVVETREEAHARAIHEAKQANADNSCGGNRTYEEVVGHYPEAEKGTFKEYAYAMVRKAVDDSQMFHCWPMAKVNFAKVIALAVQTWNGTHEGPTEEIEVIIGDMVPVPDLDHLPFSIHEQRDPLTWAMIQAVPPNGVQSVSTGRTTGFSDADVDTWDGHTFKVIKLKVNSGPVLLPKLRKLVMRAPKPARHLFERASAASAVMAQPIANTIQRITQPVKSAIHPQPPKPAWWNKPMPIIQVTPEEGGITVSVLSTIGYILKKFLL